MPRQSTRPLLSQPTPTQLQHEAPYNKARRRNPPQLRFLVKPRNAWRLLGWHVAHVAGRRNAKKTSIRQHFTMDSAVACDMYTQKNPFRMQVILKCS